MIRLAKNLYTSDTRFVFEILQNCDGNSYTKACQRGEKPTVSFNISHDRIVIDCNEDGFTVDNVKALCRIGKSSKAGSQEQIGEKGIGFKSVFKIAYKVVIQSGFLCFSFTHHKGDSGAGMITPTWEQALPMAPAGKTILTLWLRNSGNSDDMSSNIRTQLTQFESIQEEMLLFTRNLARINVEFDDSAGASRHKVSYECVKDQGSTVSTKRFQWTGSSAVPLSWERKFHLYTYTAMLPRNGNRQYGEQALATPSWATCQIALAFPLTEIFEPVLKNQWLFSFLPITQVALKVCGYLSLPATSLLPCQAHQDDLLPPRNTRAIMLTCA